MIRPRFSRRWLPASAGGLLAAVVLTLGPAGTTPAAHAATINVSRVGTTSATYDPGITLEPRVVHAFGQDVYNSCSSSDPTLHSGFDTFDAMLTLSCVQPLFSGPGETVIKWNNGQQSTLSVNGVVTTVGGQVVDTFTGSVSAGEFTGASVIAVLTEAQPNAIQCLTRQGLTRASGTDTLQILSL